MRLSEAIRLGSMVINPKPRTGSWIQWVDGKPCGGCVLGAAGVAIGLKRSTGMPEILGETWPFLYTMKVPCPTSPGLIKDVKTVIHILFEQDHWSTQQIADWVESIEPQDVPVEQSQPCAAAKG